MCLFISAGSSFLHDEVPIHVRSLCLQVALLRNQALEESSSQSQTNARVEEMCKKLMAEAKEKGVLVEQVPAMTTL